METETRINKFIAANSSFARRKIDEFIEQGRVTINNITITNPGYKINPESDKIALDGERIKPLEKKVYILLNKPAKVITAVSDDKKRTTVTDLIKVRNIFPVGRLDYETTGLLILTNDGDFANSVMNPKFKVEKTYEAQLSKPLDEKHKQSLEKGIKLEGRRTNKCVIEFLNKFDKSVVSITITEGKNRQVKRMFEHFGYFVRKLHRSKYGKLKIGNLNPGEWKFLTEKELELIK